ncbi:hypothetical protein DMENIID0001_105230 [Sergentomyia squamirostris]
MALPAFKDAFPQESVKFDSLDVMAMEVFIDENPLEDHHPLLLEDFPMQEIKIHDTDFDFPSLESPLTSPDVSADTSKSSACSSIYMDIPQEDLQDKVRTAENETLLGLEKLVIVKAPLRVVEKISYEPEVIREKTIDEELMELDQAEIKVPHILPKKKKHRSKKQTFCISKMDPNLPNVCKTPKRKKNLKTARKKLIFPEEQGIKAEEKVDDTSEPMEIATSQDGQPDKDKENKYPGCLEEKIMVTRRSLRINTSISNDRNKEVYFSCDLCQKIFKDQKMFLSHRRYHERVNLRSS